MTTASLLGLVLLSATSISRSALPPPNENRFVELTASGGVGLPALMHADFGYVVPPPLELEPQ
jgi:hypothetical protein